MIADAVYIGSLVIEDIMPALKGDPEIELVIGIDENGNLNAEAGDSGTQERQSLSVSLESLGDEVFSAPNFELDETVFDEVPSFDEEESVLDDEDFEFDEDSALEDSGLEDDASFDELPSLDEDLSFDEELSAEELSTEEPAPDDDLSFDEELDEDLDDIIDEETSFDDDLSFDKDLDEEPSFDDDLSFDDELSIEKPALDDDLSFDDDIDEDIDEDDVPFSDEEPSFDDDLSFDEDSAFDDSDDTDEEPAEAKRERPHRTLALVVLIILILAILGIGAYFIFKSVNGTSVPELQADSPSKNEQPVVEEVAEAEPEPEPVVEAVEAPVVEEPEEKAVEPAASEVEAAGSQGLPPTGSGGGVWYRLKWGDTLWDLSNSFYRTPWLYKIIAVENDIKNPDVIYAGDDIHIPEN